MKLASGRLLSKDSMGDGNEGIRVLLGLLMSPSPTRVRSVWVSSSTVRRFGRVSMGREMGERWVPNVGWRGGANKHRLAPECPLALELREESRLSERRLEVRAPREGTPFSRVCLKESGVELDTSGGVRRRKSGSTRCSLFRSPRWSLALVLCARLSSSKNSSASSIFIFFCFLFSPGSAESGPLALTEKSFGVDLSSPVAEKLLVGGWPFKEEDLDLSLPEDGSARSNTTRRPSKLDMGAPRSKGSVSPLILATRSLRWRPYLATTGRRTSVTGLVGLAFSPTERLIGTRSNLNKVRFSILKSRELRVRQSWSNTKGFSPPTRKRSTAAMLTLMF